MIRKLPHCSPRGWPAILSSPTLGRPYLYEGDRAAAPRGWLRDRPDRALPGRAITYDRVEYGQQLAGDRDEGDLLRLSHCYEALIEGFQHRVVLRGDHSADEQGFAHARPPPTNETLAAPLARLAGEAGEADKRGDLLAIKASKFRQLGNQGPRDCRADGGYRGQQVLLLTPGWRAAHGIVNVRIDARELTLERLHEPADALLDAGIGPFLALLLGSDHVDDLAPAGDEIGELLGGLVRQRPWYDTRCLAEVGDHAGIDRVGLGALADGFGEGADLRRVGDRNRQAGPGEGRNYDRLEAAGGLEDDEVGLHNLETRHEVVEPGTSARDSETLTTRTHGNIEAVLRYVDTNGDLLHGDPSLSKRARGAAPATVRVRWNGGRGAKLSNDLRGPKVRRTPARHRASLARRVG